MASSLLRILSGRRAQKKWLFLRGLLKKTPFPRSHLSHVPPCPERHTCIFCLFPRQAGLWFFCTCAQSGAVTASPSCWKPQRPPGTLPLSPGPGAAEGLPLACPSSLGHPPPPAPSSPAGLKMLRPRALPHPHMSLGTPETFRSRHPQRLEVRSSNTRVY